MLDRFREIEARMGAATDGQEIVRLGKEHAELKPVVDAVQALQKVRDEAPELEEMASGGDPEMAAMAREELEALKDRLPGLEHEVALLLAPKDRDENASAILEVRARHSLAGCLLRLASVRRPRSIRLSTPSG